MGLFQRSWDKEGPGIDKNAPEKKGISRVWEILTGHFSTIIGVNLLFVLACIPLVTIPPALGAMYAVIIRLVERKPVYLWSDFWEAFRKNWKDSYKAGIIYALVLTAGFYYLWGALTQGKNWMLVAGCFVLLLFGITAAYLYPMIIKVDLPFQQNAKNAMLLGLSRMGRTLPTTLVVYALFALVAFFFPMTLPVALCFLFSFCTLWRSVFAWEDICTYVLQTEPSVDEPEE